MCMYMNYYSAGLTRRVWAINTEVPLRHELV